MSIRKGSTIIAGTGGSGNSDYLVNQNISSSITKIYDWVGTLAEYEEQDVKHLHPDWVCFITNDSGQLDPNKKAMFTNRNVGDIFFTSRLDSKLNGAVPCDGTVYQLEDYSEGSDSIANLLLKNKLPYITTADYEIALSQNGNVGVFGWDGENATTFRVPTLDSIFIEAGQANRVGYYITPGLPNITGSTAAISATNEYINGSLSNSTLVAGNYGAQFSTDYPSKNRYITLDASLSSPLYGASSTVQPKAVKYRAMVQLLVGLSDEAVDTCNDLREHAVRDTDLATLLQTIYPVGSVYIGTQSTCPMATVIPDSTWESVGTSLVTSVNTSASVKGNGQTLGLKTANSGTIYLQAGSDSGLRNGTHFLTAGTSSTHYTTTFGASEQTIQVTNDSSKSGLTADITRTQLTVNIWKRTA